VVVRSEGGGCHESDVPPYLFLASQPVMALSLTDTDHADTNPFIQLISLHI
jgi:hypothetical protein